MFKKGDILRHLPTNSKVEVIEILEKKFLQEQQVLAKCLKSSIPEDKGRTFEYDLNNLVLIKKAA